MENKNLKNSWAIGFTVASVWFGTHVGGGFASGKQVIGYFAKFGAAAALIYPILSMGILAFIMHVMLKFARLNGFTNYKDTYSALYPKPWMEIFFEISTSSSFLRPSRQPSPAPATPWLTSSALNMSARPRLS